MDSNINQSNYVEWLKIVQKCYLIAYICAFVILSHILSLDTPTLEEMQSLPLFGVSLPRVPAVLFTLFLFWGTGLVVVSAYEKLKHIGQTLPSMTLEALYLHPSIGNSSWKLEAPLVLGLFLIFWTTFANGRVEMPIYKSAFLGFVMVAPFVLAVGQKIFNKLSQQVAACGASA